MRKLASIQKILEIRPIPEADKIVVVKILGWECVALKTEFSIGDKCVFFEIDSIVPVMPWSSHLCKDGKPLRVRSIRLKKQLSQGLALPMSLLPVGNYEVGQDVTLETGVIKYEPYIPAELHGKVKGTRPSWIPKTDEPRLQSAPDALDEIKKMGQVVGTVKMDGSSITCFIKDNVFGVTSRNMELIETEDNAYWKAVREAKVEEAMRKFFPCGLGGGDYAIQGELCCPGIQGNRMGFDKLTLCWYNVFHINTGTYMSHKILNDFTLSTGLQMVQVVFIGKLSTETTLKNLLEMANNLNYNNGLPAEGIVWRPVEEMRSEVLKTRMSFKTISNRYLETYKE